MSRSCLLITFSHILMCPCWNNPYLKKEILIWFTVRTLRFLLHVLVDFFPDWINYKYWTISIKIHRTVFLLLYYSSYYMYWLENFPPFTNIYVLVHLKNMGWNIYKTSTYNRNLSVLFSVLYVVVHSFPSWLIWGRNQVYCACCSAKRPIN